MGVLDAAMATDLDEHHQKLELQQQELQQAVLQESLPTAVAAAVALATPVESTAGAKAGAIPKSESSSDAIIFLGIDGVLNRRTEPAQICIERDLVSRLWALVEATDAKIVLSSFWRHFQEYISYVLLRHGMPQDVVIGTTPGVSDAWRLSTTTPAASTYATRAQEISAWLEANPNTRRFVIIDRGQSASNYWLERNYVQTDPAVGLSAEDCKRCFALLLPDDGEAPGS